MLLSPADSQGISNSLERTRKKQRLLIVDDEHDITFVLKMMLGEYYDVEAYLNPVETLVSVKPSRHDLILFDYLMPEMNGYDSYPKPRRSTLRSTCA